MMSPDSLGTGREALRLGMRWMLAIFYFSAGIIHIRSPGAFLPIVPDWVPFPNQVVLLTGVAEIAGAVGLIVPFMRLLSSRPI